MKKKKTWRITDFVKASGRQIYEVEADSIEEALEKYTGAECVSEELEIDHVESREIDEITD